MSSKLFIIIAISDLLTNSYPALHVLYFCTAPNIDFSTQVDYTKPVDPEFKHYVVPSLFMCTFGCLSQVSTAVLAVVRMVSIYKPFLDYPKWLPFVYISVFGTLMFCNEIVYTTIQFLEIDDALKSVMDKTIIVCLSLNISHCVLGILASFLTMLNIALKKRVEDSRIRSHCIIILMNVPYFFSVVNYAFSKTLFEKYGYFFLAFVAVSCLTSMLNPLIIVVLNRDLKKYIKSLICKNTQVNPTSGAIPRKRGLGNHIDGQNTGSNSIDVMADTTPAATWATSES